MHRFVSNYSPFSVQRSFHVILFSFAICRDGWERLGLFEYYAKKNEIKKEVEEKLKSEGKTLEEAIENVYIEEKEEEKERRSVSRYIYFNIFVALF